eukprot:366402-Chlamydomonas_euryale.AAC.2
MGLGFRVYYAPTRRRYAQVHEMTGPEAAALGVRTPADGTHIPCPYTFCPLCGAATHRCTRSLPRRRPPWACHHPPTARRGRLPSPGTSSLAARRPRASSCARQCGCRRACG